MADPLNHNADDEMRRYEDAQNIKMYSGITPENLRGGIVRHDPIRKVDAVYVDLPSGGQVHIGDRPSAPQDIAATDAIAQQQSDMVAPQPGAASSSPIDPAGRAPIETIIGDASGPKMEDYVAAGYTEKEVLDFQAWDSTRLEAEGIARGDKFPVKLTDQQMSDYAAIPGAQTVQATIPSVRDRVQGLIYNAMDAGRQPPTGAVSETIQSGLQALVGSDVIDPADMRFWSSYMTDLVDLTVPGVGGAISTDEGVRMVKQGWDTGNPIDMLIGSVVAAFGAAELAPIVKGLTQPAIKSLMSMSPEARNILSDAIGASRAIAQGDKNMLWEVFQPSGTPRSLGAASPMDTSTFKIGPPTETPGIGGLDSQYRVTVEGFTPEGNGKRSFIPQQMTPRNRDAADASLSNVAQEFPDPLSSPEAYAGMMARVRNSAEVPAPPTWMIENANNTDQWASWFKGLTPDQIKAADEGLSVQDKFRTAYANPSTGPELTGQLMFWSIMSRMLSAFPHESGFLELAQGADPYIRKALAGEWTDATTAEWRNMVSSTIPLDSPGRSATSNANAFGETFLRKMSVKGESGKSSLEQLHEMIADPNMSSAEIRRAYYGLAEQTGIGNKILSFALLVSGRNDVVVLDRIQINRMWAGGDKIYDDIMSQFEGAQGLAQYEALERSLASRVGDVYDKVGRPADASVGRYHWESWVLSSGQVVSHPTLEAVVRAGTPNVKRNMPATAATPVTEGRFHTKYSGVSYEKLPSGGSRYVYSTSDGQPYQFTKAQLDAMFDEAFKKKSGVLPPDFPGVKAFEGGNIPWFKYKGVDRGKLDALIKSAGKPAK